MPAPLPARHIGIPIARPFDAVYGFLAEPANWPRWASGLGAMQRRPDGSWTADQETGRVGIVFAPRNAFGVLDHSVTLPNGDIVRVPLRVVRNNDGSEVIFTLFRQPGMDDTAFERDAAWIAQDLAKLKTLLENDA
ncbi:MAG TPA: polyketide cyclase [Ferrovibrio sp.]|uniref:polyketide cyclase n=1 Tax=Ferrovibrio sp. TaxID=1917215 RepID=UPI002ED3B14D